MTDVRFPKPKDRLSHKRLANERTVKPWLDSLTLKSRGTADVNLRRLGIFLWSTRLTTDRLVRLANKSPKELRDLLVAYALAAKEEEYLGTYVRRILVSVRSYLRFQGSKFDQFPAVQAISGESLIEERVPTPDELRLLLTALTARGRVVALSLAHAGLRPGVLSNMTGTDGLTLGDLPDLRVEQGEVRFNHIPLAIVVPARLSKIRKSYLTFGTAELAEALQVYLRERISKGETLTATSPVIASVGMGKGSADRVGKFLKPAGRFVSEKSIAYDLRDAIRKVRPGGQVFRPYTLRAFCATQLLLAESHGKIVRDAREHFLGHDLGSAGRYHLGKKLHPTVVDELRTMYERASSYLSTDRSRASASDDDLRRLFVTEFLQIPEAEVAKLGTLSNEKIRELAAAKKRDEEGSDETPAPGTQKVVEVGAAEAYISKGWKFVAQLNGMKVILSAPD